MKSKKEKMRIILYIALYFGIAMTYFTTFTGECDDVRGYGVASGSIAMMIFLTSNKK